MAAIQKRKDALFWGFILVAVGVLLLLRNFDFDALHYLARLWPVILIAWGLWKLYLSLSHRKEAKTESPKQAE